MDLPYKKDSGFTLLELVIVLSIILIFLGMMVQRWVAVGSTQQLHAFGQKMIGLIHIYEDKAYQAQHTCQDGAQFMGYQLEANSSVLVVSEQCGAELTESARLQAPAGLTLQFSSSQSVLLPTRIGALTQTLSQNTLTIKDQKQREYSIIIVPGGTSYTP